MGKKIIGGVALLMGTIIGVGLFGIPYALELFGFWPGLIMLAVLAATLTITTLAYTDLVLAAPHKIQFAEIIRTYLGKPGFFFASFVMIASLYGAMLAYTIEIGNFFSTLLAPLIELDGRVFSVLFYAVGAVVIAFGLKSVVNSELIFVGLIILAIFAFGVIGIPNIQMENLSGFHPGQWLTIYGVLLFALPGFMAVPDLVRVVSKDRCAAKTAVLIGTTIPALLYGLFALAVVGVCGPETTQSAVGGFGDVFGTAVLLLGSALGVLAIGTSFIVTGYVTWEIFQFDWKFPRLGSFFLAMAPPLVVYLVGNSTFIGVISFVGAFTIGLIGILMLVSWLKLKHRTGGKSLILRLPSLIIWILIGLYTIALAYEIVTLFT